MTGTVGLPLKGPTGSWIFRTFFNLGDSSANVVNTPNAAHPIPAATRAARAFPTCFHSRHGEAPLQNQGDFDNQCPKQPGRGDGHKRQREEHHQHPAHPSVFGQLLAVDINHI